LTGDWGGEWTARSLGQKARREGVDEIGAAKDGD